MCNAHSIQTAGAYTLTKTCISLSLPVFHKRTPRQRGQSDLLELSATHHFPVITSATSNPISIRCVPQNCVCVRVVSACLRVLHVCVQVL